MSNNVNTNLLEEAAFYIDYFEDKLPAQMLEADLEANDMDSLATHLNEARLQAFDQEFSAKMEAEHA